MDTIKVYIIKEDGSGSVKEVRNDYFGFLKAMNISHDDYFTIHQIYINNKPYDLYVVEYIDIKKQPKITAMYRNKERCFIGNLLITRHDKNQELISLIDKDVENIQNSICDRNLTGKKINGDYYEMSDRILMI